MPPSEVPLEVPGFGRGITGPKVRRRPIRIQVRRHRNYISKAKALVLVTLIELALYHGSIKYHLPWPHTSVLLLGFRRNWKFSDVMLLYYY